ncbi:MAG: hypothetical protein GYA23_12455 [Methanomicrobiales archaeon]|nr:hypothetical protein [Methanomicrobiales archaeon]
MAGKNPGATGPHPSISPSQQTVLGLLVIPLLVYCAWLIEIWLFEDSRALFSRPDPAGLLLYTLAACILVGTIVPVLILTRSFRSRAVNMPQAGFRPLRRTLLTAILVGSVCLIVMLVSVQEEPARTALPVLVLLYLPTGIASVMICWVLTGTHIQALVRGGGALLTIPAGMVFAAILFGLTFRFHTPAAGLADPVMTGILLGMVTGFVFFASRDIYGAVMVATTGMVLLFPGMTDPAELTAGFLGILSCALLSLACLGAVHLWLFRNYATVLVGPDP